MKSSIPQNQEPVDYVRRSLEPKFDWNNCAIILLKRGIIIWHKANVAHVDYKLKGRWSLKFS